MRTRTIRLPLTGICLAAGLTLLGCVPILIPVPAPTSAPPGPEAGADVSVTAMLSDNAIGFGEAFELFAVVRNSGNAPAEDVHVFLRMEPSGYFELLGASHPTEGLAPSGLKISVGTLSPGGREEITLRGRAPTQEQMGGRYGINFEFKMTYDYAGSGERAGDQFVATVSESGPVFGVGVAVATPTR
jgi:hypothetical protein